MVTRLHLPHAIVVRLYTNIDSAVILTFGKCGPSRVVYPTIAVDVACLVPQAHLMNNVLARNFQAPSLLTFINYLWTSAQIRKLGTLIIKFS